MQIEVTLNDGRVMTVNMIEEFKKCKKDPLYFINNYCYIIDPVKGELPFKLFDYQKEALEAFENHQFNVVKKPRQMGLSWLTACYGLWLINFHNDKSVLIISIRDGEAMEFKDKARYSYDRLPDFLMVTATDKSKHGLNLANGSQFQSVPQTKQAGRSKALSLLILDEVAFQEHADDIWAAAWPALSTGGNAILISTTNGIGNLYHRVYEEAQSEQNDFHPIDVEWTQFPGRDEVWLEKQKRQLGDRKFRSEIMCEFLGSGDTVISGKILAKLQAQVKDPYIKYRLPMDDSLAKTLLNDEYNFIPGLWIWEPSNPGERYILSADVGTGNEQDSSAFHIIRLRDNMQVCEYKDKSTTSTRYAKIIKMAATYYNNAFVVIESNSWGLATFEHVYKHPTEPYTNVYITKKGRASWETTGKTRPQIIDCLINSIEREEYKIMSPRLLSELKTFIWRGARPEALKGYNDDLVISFAIMALIRPKLSSYLPMGFTSSEDAAAFKYDEESIKKFHEKRDIVHIKRENPYGEDEFTDDGVPTEYDDSGQMTQKAIYKWLSN